jgi:hypothetical protein
MSTNSKTSVRAIDEPLDEPQGDLLDMDRHAKALADYIKQDRKLPSRSESSASGVKAKRRW